MSSSLLEWYSKYNFIEAIVFNNFNLNDYNNEH